MANTFKNYLSSGVTSDTTVYTAPNATQCTVIGMNIANTTSLVSNVSVQVTSGSTTIYLVKSAPIPTGGALVPIGGDQKMVLEAGDLLKVTADNSVDVIVSSLEIA